MLKFLLNTRMAWVIFTEILMTTIQIKKVLVVFENMNSDMFSNKKL